MIAASAVDQAKDDLNLVGILLAFLGAAIAFGGPKLLDEGHRQVKNGYLAGGIALLGLGLTVTQLVLMAGLVWSSLIGSGHFEPWLLTAVMYFVAITAVAVWLACVLVKAVAYTRRAAAD